MMTLVTDMMTLNRREFLKKSGWVAGGITILSGCSYLPALPTLQTGEKEDALGWIQLLKSGELLFFCPRSEMGQGIETGLTAVVAEELWINPTLINCKLPRTNQILPTKSTVGSQSVQDYFEPTALAAATLREKLRELAAHQLGTNVDTLSLTEGGFVDVHGTRIAYSQIVAKLTTNLVLMQYPDPLPEIRSLTQRNFVGKHSAMGQIEEIIHGEPVFVRDVHLQGMRFGAVVKPVFLGARLMSFDRQAAMAVPGVDTVVDGPADLPGIIARTPMALRRALDALDCQWNELTPTLETTIHPDLDIDHMIAEDALRHTELDLQQPGVSGAIKSRLNLRFDTPMLAHAAMEPRSGIAWVQDSQCDVWTASQDPFYVQRATAKLLGLAEDKVIVRNHRIGGAFGGRIVCQATLEAAWLSAAVSKPVKVQWTREDEFAHNYAGPQFSHRIKIELNQQDKIQHWQHQLVSSPIMIPRSLVPKPIHWILDMTKDKGVSRGSVAPYEFQSHIVEYNSDTIGMPTGAWRGLGSAPNAFAVECAMDEAARAANKDPVAFRLNHTDNPRLRKVIEEVRDLSRWTDKTHRGVAATIYKAATYVAVVAETSIISGVPVVNKLWCVQDSGIALSPDRIRAQIEGNLVWAVSMVLTEKFTMDKGIATSNNFDKYPIARQQHIPEIVIKLLDSSEKPTGAGEPAFAPAVAAIANSLTRTTGHPVRQLPLRDRNPVA